MSKKPQSKTLGANIRAARQSKDLSVAEAAAAIGVAEQTWYRWERDAIEPGLATLRDVAATTGTTVADLVRGL